ncbi:DUF3866 family protein [Varibaculum prostatecancerukia]|uniref:DUF3866 family protein n=1 Tax=Varibaculum prostatecancerukia TaxID=2811781 RepID=UPI001C005690|nr:DUF3866 family protein [Varibaculum prostatecancerukia]
MMLREGHVEAVRNFESTQELTVKISAHPAGAKQFLTGENLRALNYPALNGEVSEGDEVRFDCSPLQKNLGTGGFALVTALCGRLPEDQLPTHGGHIMKARYTPSQYMVSSVEEQESPFHEQMRQAENLDGMPVVGMDLHSQLPAVIVGIRAENRQAKIVYIYTDGGAVPAFFSRNITTLREKGWLDSVITAGQSFGGDLEAINTFSGLLAARQVLKADIAIMGQGPGNAGSGTPYGYSGFDLGAFLTQAALGGGKAICALRMSAADLRPRHQGISHHSLRIISSFVPVPITVPVPEFTDEGEGQKPLLTSDFTQIVDSQVKQISSRHRVQKCSTAGLYQALSQCPVRLSTMRRSLDEDAAPFLAAAVAGRLAAQML